ncbi:hypothetical protein HDU83_001459 [Entophlyctis luteolus]|nr:hypothetical protein HDU82_006182 [Entophlyctis luteolus]KAJ3348219.1 hypothetical protein HDU83_001459 [Entophlyctis luteolus]
MSLRRLLVVVGGPLRSCASASAPASAAALPSPPTALRVAPFSSTPNAFARLRLSSRLANASASSPSTESGGNRRNKKGSSPASTNSAVEDVEEDQLLMDAMPQGVSLDFYKRYLALVDALDEDAALLKADKKRTKNSKTQVSHPPPGLLDGSLLRFLVAETRSTQDANLLTDALARWRRHPRTLEQDGADNALICHALINNVNDAHGSLLLLALNPFKYGVHLSQSQVHLLMNRLASDVVNSLEANAASPLLDNLYKAFAILLRSNVSPTPQSYLPLVCAGAYSKSKDAWEYAKTSLREAEWIFGGPENLPPEIYNAAVAGFIKHGEYDSAVSLAERVISVASRLRLEAYTMSGLWDKAVAVLSEPNLNEPIANTEDAFAERWTSVAEIQQMLLKELKEKDEALYAKAMASTK